MFALFAQFILNKCATVVQKNVHYCLIPDLIPLQSNQADRT